MPDNRYANLLKIDTAEFVLSALDVRQFLRDDRPQVVFAGRSNVGKSSLLNRLLGRKALARTSSTPGRTRAVNYFLINRRFYFVDLPGYGYAKASKQDRQAWAELMDRYCRDSLARALVVLLVDAKVGATDLDVEAIQYLSGFGGSIIVVATKMDRLNQSGRHSALAEIRRRLQLGEQGRILGLSVRTGEGVNELWSVLNAHLRAA